MPSSDIGKTLDRIWLLLELLPTDGVGATSAQLLQRGEEEFHWGLNKRTIERYLVALKSADLATTSGRSDRAADLESRAQRWLAHSTRNLHRARLSTHEALALHLVERVADQLLPPEIVDVLRARMDSARSHLSVQRKVNKSAAWADKVAVLPEGFSLQPPSLDRSILKTLQRALLADEQVQCVYQATSRSEGKKYALEPRGLVQRGGVLYIIATRPDHPERAAAWYCVHRFKAVTPTPRSNTRSDFQLGDFLSKGGADFGAPGEPIAFKAWVSPRLAATLRETPLSDDMRLKPTADGALITATVRQSWPFESWLLSRGEQLRIIAPDLLRKETVTRLQEAINSYR